MRNRTLNCLLVVATLTIVGAFSTSAMAQPPIPQTNLLTWLAADNINGDETNPAGGAPVSNWVDLSGNENHFITMVHDGAFTSTPPTYSTSGGSLGWPSVEFDGISDMLSHTFWTSNDPFDPQPWSSPQIFMVMKATPGPDQSRIIGTNGQTLFNWTLDDSTGGLRGTARENLAPDGTPTTGNYRYLNRTGFDNMTPTPSVADYKVLSLYTDVPPAGFPQRLLAHTQSIGQDVTTLGTDDGAYGTNSANFPADVAIPYTPPSAHHTYDLGLGGDTDGSSWSEMSISELIVYDSPTGYPMPEVDRLAVESYLYDKYFVDGPSVQNADFDGSGFVDGVDFLAWQRGHGTGTMLAQGDANGDMMVDDADLAIWEGQYGTSPLVAASSAVPEPSALLLTMLACCCLTLSNRTARV